MRACRIQTAMPKKPEHQIIYPALRASDRLAALAALFAKAAVRSVQKEGSGAQFEPVIKPNPVKQETSVCCVRMEKMLMNRFTQPGLFDEDGL